MEEFKDIKEYEGLYQVSSLGRVKSLNYNHTKKEKILKPTKDINGYLTINLYKEGKKKRFYVHRLVAEAFISNPNNYPCVNHKDENPSNDNVDNLEWCDYKYNTNYGTCIQRRIANTDYKAIAAKIDYKAIAEKIDYKEVARKQSKPVLQFTKDNVFVREWSSTRECARNGFKHSAVSRCCNGKLKTYKGYIWRYKE